MSINCVREKIFLLKISIDWKCPCCYRHNTAKAVNDVSVGLGCTIMVTKTRRCSGQWEDAADALSKGEWTRAWGLMPGKETDPRRLPVTLLVWLHEPCVDLSLGSRILDEMVDSVECLHLKGQRL